MITATITTQELLKKRIGMISLGCDKNRVDSEYVLYLLKEYGFSITTSIENAEVILINSCAFLESARREAIEAAFEAVRCKTEGACEKIIMLGCMSQRYGDQLKKDMPEIDEVVKIADYPNIVNILRKAYGLKNTKNDSPNYVCKRVLSTQSHYAYLKIADGCNNFCSYCLIPSIRGRFTSRPIQDIVNEAKELVKFGVKELILVAQDTTRYGIDLYKKPQLVYLIKELSKIKDLKWIRLHYCYPEMVTDELINEVSTNPKVCKYLDIPLQHIDSEILKAMNRRSSSESIKELIQKIRTVNSDIAIRTSLIVGFPGETKEQFNNLVDFLQEYKLNYVGCFNYSREAGTRAYDFENQIAEKVKKTRNKKVMKLQEKIVKVNNEKYINTVQEVVVEAHNENLGYYVCRNQYNSPDVDTVVFVTTDKELQIGSFIDVTITEVLGYDLKGEIIDEN